MTTNAELQQRKDRVLARGLGNLVPVFANHMISIICNRLCSEIKSPG
jgi:hypothetical protein